MKKALVLMVTLMFVLVGTTVFAQDSDYDYVDVSDTGSMEAYLGFQFNMYKNVKDELDFVNSPAIELAWRQYVMPLSDTMSVGYTVLAGLIFKDPPGDFDSYWNINMVAGGTLKGEISGPLGFVVDGGLGIMADIFTMNTAWLPNYEGGLVPNGQYRWIYDDMYISLGVAGSGGLQYRLPMGEKNELIFELGASLAYYFFHYNTVTIDIEVRNNSNANLNGRTNLYEAESKTESAGGLSISPYFMVGYSC